MKADREQVLLGAIDILTHPELPFELSGTKLYGKTKTEREETDMDADCRIYQLSNETGSGKITAKIGYENPNKFTSAFKKTYGVTPTEFKKRCPIG